MLEDAEKQRELARGRERERERERGRCLWCCGFPTAERERDGASREEAKAKAATSSQCGTAGWTDVGGADDDDDDAAPFGVETEEEREGRREQGALLPWKLR